MKSVFCRRLLFALTTLATFSMICSESFARGPGGGRRSGGGRAGASTRGGGGGARSGRAISQPTRSPGQLRGTSAGAGNHSPRSGGLNSGLADKSQLQGLLGKQSGQLSSKLSEQSGKLQQNGQFQQNAQSKANQFQSASQPFSPAWYADHPNAWQATHPHADAAVVASTAAVTAWVGAGYAPASSGGSSTTVIYEEAPREAAPEEAANATSTLPVATTNASPAPPANAEEWFPVGIYSLATTKLSPPTVMLQLVVDHQGKLRGVYYDSITDTTHNIVGTLDPNTRVARWQLESSGQAIFQASLNELTQPTGKLQVKLASGPQQWLLTRVEK